MLTIHQLLVAAGGNGRAPMSTSVLLQTGPQRPLSLSSLISGYSKQRRAYFIELISPKILSAPDVNSLSDLVQERFNLVGQMSKEEVESFSEYLLGYGIRLKFVDKYLRTAALVGTVGDLVTVPVTGASQSNFITIKNKWAAGYGIGGTVIAAGAVVAGAAVAPPLVAAVGVGAAETLFWVGIVVVVGGAAFVITEGIMDLTAPSGPHSSLDSTEIPNDTGPDGPADDTIEIPSSVVVGTPSDGIDPDQLLGVLGDYSVDVGLLPLPTGWDPDGGGALPGIGTDPGDSSDDPFDDPSGGTWNA